MMARHWAPANDGRRGRATASRISAPNSTRRKTVPVGPRESKSRRATVAPTCTEAIAPSASKGAGTRAATRLSSLSRVSFRGALQEAAGGVATKAREPLERRGHRTLLDLRSCRNPARVSALGRQPSIQDGQRPGRDPGHDTMHPRQYIGRQGKDQLSLASAHCRDDSPGRPFGIDGDDRQTREWGEQTELLILRLEKLGVQVRSGPHQSRDDGGDLNAVLGEFGSQSLGESNG